MTLLLLAMVVARIGTLAASAASEPVDVAFKALNLGLAGVFLYLLITGTLRRAGEVTDIQTRLTAAEARADKEAAARERIQDAVMSELTPAMIEFRMAGERLVQAQAEAAEMNKRLVEAFLQRISRD